jgi:hypothetical protein
MLPASTAPAATSQAAPSSAPLPAAGALIAQGHVSSGGLDGTWYAVADLAGPRRALTIDLGAYWTGEAHDGTVLWEIEPSGGSHRIDSDYARADEVTQDWLSRFGWLQQGWAAAQRGTQRMANENGQSYRVVTMTPRGGPRSICGSSLLAATPCAPSVLAGSRCKPRRTQTIARQQEPDCRS